MNTSWTPLKSAIALALIQPFNRPVANLHPHQPQCRQPDRRGHAPYLTITPFANHQFQP